MGTVRLRGRSGSVGRDDSDVIRYHGSVPGRGAGNRTTHH